jgi:hypothetical protein
MKESDIRRIVKRVINETRPELNQNEDLKKVLNVVMGLYDLNTFNMSSSVRYKNLVIKTMVEFTPKDVNNPLTPCVARSAAVWEFIVNKNSFSFYDCTYIRPREMPVLDYINGTYWMDEYVESLHKKMIEEYKDKYI